MVLQTDQGCYLPDDIAAAAKEQRRLREDGRPYHYQDTADKSPPFAVRHAFVEPRGGWTPVGRGIWKRNTNVNEHEE